MTKLFVGGLPYSLTQDKLRDLFAEKGQVISCDIIFDKFSGQSKGFAFVEISEDADAQKAIKELDGVNVEGRNIHVSVARAREESPNRGGFQNNRYQGNNNYNRNRNRR